MNEKSLLMRPQVGELTFQLFDRPVHPELIDTVERREYDRDGYQLRLDVTPAGHWLQWRYRGLTLVEVLADQEQLLPETRQLFAHRVANERSEKQEPASGVRYETCFQVERLPAELFFHVHDELCSGGRDGVLHLLQPHDRMGLSPLSYIDLQARTGSLLIHTFHTFPDDYAIVKTQTLIEKGE